MNTGDQPVISVANVVRTFASAAETIRAVDDVSFQVEPSEVVALVGPSGSGKSTLLNLVVGWDTADSGTIRHHQGNASNWDAVAIVPQDLGLLPELTARQNVELGGRWSSVDRTRISTCASVLLDRLGVGELCDRLPAEMSLGEQQRVAVARAAICSPQLVVADEPTSHLDEQRADVVMQLLRQIAEDGGAVLVATHDDRLLSHVDRTVELLDGRVR